MVSNSIIRDEKNEANRKEKEFFMQIVIPH